jgi:hypothetical protein
MFLSSKQHLPNAQAPESALAMGGAFEETGESSVKEEQVGVLPGAAKNVGRGECRHRNGGLVLGSPEDMGCILFSGRVMSVPGLQQCEPGGYCL